MGLEICKPTSCQTIRFCTTAIKKPRTKVTITASFGHMTRLIKNATIIDKTKANSVSSDIIMCMAKGIKTPANIAPAIDCGMSDIRRSNQPETPTKVIKIEHSTKAPVASAKGTPAKLVTKIAAPGVDHAVRIGCL